MEPLAGITIDVAVLYTSTQFLAKRGRTVGLILLHVIVSDVAPYSLRLAAMFRQPPTCPQLTPPHMYVELEHGYNNDCMTMRRMTLTMMMTTKTLKANVTW